MTPVFYNFSEKRPDHAVDIDLKCVVGEPFVRCPVYPKEHPGSGRIRINDLHIILPSARVTDLMVTWHTDYIITDAVASLFAKHALTGYTLAPVTVTQIRRPGRNTVSIPRLWELKVTGWGGLAPEESGIRSVYKCSACGYQEHSPLTDPTKLIDTNQWDGSDFFMIWPLPKFVFVTERVKKLVIENTLSNVSVVPLPKMEAHIHGASPDRLWHYLGREQAKKFGGPLGIE